MGESGPRKRKDDPFDDFFALSAPSGKKHKKKRPREKKVENHEDEKRNENSPETINIDVDVETSPPAPNTSSPGPSRENSDSHNQKMDNRDEKPLNDITVVDDAVDDIAVQDIVDEEDELLEFLKETSASLGHHKSDTYDFSDSNERRRSYVVRVISKLEPENAVTVDIGTKGLKKFDKIHEAALRELRKKPGSPMKQHNVHTTCLAWIEGRQEIKPFFKPSTLRIKPPLEFIGQNPAKIPLTHITCLLYPKSHSYLDYPEFESNSSWKKLSQLSSDLSAMDELSVLSANSELSDEDPLGDSNPVANPVANTPRDTPDSQPDADYFEIGLKGKDNKRISVQVCSTTKLRDLLAHYLKAKEIDVSAASRAKLLFDDEELDLNGVVGDTELEDEYEVQVVV